jgi:molecular chaperone DnaK (HSP70)
MAVAVGIDLGTTYSAVAWVGPDGDPVILPDEDGAMLTPSVVSFADGTPVVGEAAKADQGSGEPEVAAFFKRSMGDVSFTLSLAGRDWSPTALSGLVLAHLKAQAERALGQEVTQAVVTVPEYFTHPQRAATMEAGRLAGLDVRRIISEPTAAALAYGLRPGADLNCMLVYDLGGGTFDVSVVRLSGDSVEVVAAAGDHQLGGREWDDRLALLLQQRFARDTGADLLAGDPGGLLVEVERLKRALSARQSAELRVGADGRSARYSVSRSEFEEASGDLLERTGQLTAQALADAGLTWADIDGVLPVGGSTRMPMVREWIERMSGRPPVGGIHPDQAVALGAAVQAALLIEQAAAGRLAPGERAQDAGGGAAPMPTLRPSAPRHVRDVVAHSLGMIAESADRSRYVNSVLLRRNTAIPCEEPRPYQFGLRDDGSDLLEVFLTQGETDDPAECAYLGRYVVTGFPAGASGPAVIDISYAYDENAVVTVAAADRATKTALDVRVDKLPPDVPERFLGPPPTAGAREPATIYLAIDVSGSMSGRPLDEAKRAAKTFVSQLDLTTTAVGLIAVSDCVHVDQEASQNATVINKAISDLRMGSTGGGNAAHPFDELYRLLNNRDGRRYGLVLADGVWDNQELAVRQAQRCHKAGIDIIAIGFGYADRRFLNQIASSTEQAVFTDLNGLTSAFSTIARELTEGGGTRLGARRPPAS